MRISDLSAEFPREAIHWRAQSLTRNGDKALALAYLDARDVMDRLDEVCGPENWQSEFTETAKGRVICRIGIQIGDDWVWKSDGAGNTDVEGEKGGISDALKRAAVHWGIGRYLYRMEAVWAPCETYEKSGKKVWSKWVGTPWDHVRGARKPAPTPPNHGETRDRIKAAIVGMNDAATLDKLWMQTTTKEAMDRLPQPMQAELQSAYSNRMGEVCQAPEDS